jgi:hypothetical protein
MPPSSDKPAKDVNDVIHALAQLNEKDQKTNPHLPKVELYGDKSSPDWGVKEIKLAIPGDHLHKAKTETIITNPEQVAQDNLVQLDPHSKNYADYFLDHPPTAREMANFLKDGKLAKFKAVFHDQIVTNMEASASEQVMDQIAKMNRADRLKNPNIPEFTYKPGDGTFSATLKTQKDETISLYPAKNE